MIENSLEKLKQLNKEIKKLKDLKTLSFLKEAFEEGIKEIFNTLPSLYGFTWTQYTPYFNDGDACVFSWSLEEVYIQNPETPLNITTEELEELIDNDEQIGLEYSYKDSKEHREAINKLLNLFEQEELEEMFGEGSKITYTKEYRLESEYQPC